MDLGEYIHFPFKSRSEWGRFPGAVAAGSLRRAPHGFDSEDMQEDSVP